TVLTQNNAGDIPFTQVLQNWVNKGLTYRVMNDTTGATPGQGVAQTVYVRQTGGFPTFVVIDKDFSVQYIQGGFSQSRIEAKVEELLSK
ncbi:MAG: hypothetical protein LWX11_11750, partial [Firmicutes bacterium]|nr:hypothetical protein [Bacillota bacterium]